MYLFGVTLLVFSVFDPGVVSFLLSVVFHFLFPIVHICRYRITTLDG